MINIQFLFIEGCPYSETAWINLQKCLNLLHIDIHPERIEIHDDLEADHYSFLGSPSIKVDGVDLWESAQTEYHMGIRVYSTPVGPSECPTIDMLVERFAELRSNSNH